MISKNKITLKEACKIKDEKNSGFITVAHFKEALGDVDINFPDKVFNYMSLLFYSHNYELDSVPYRHFLKAYGSALEEPNEYEEEEYEEGDEINDEERAKIVRYYLDIFGKSLNKAKKTVKEVFECNKQGLISPEQFVKAIQYLKIFDINENHTMLILEALQYEEETEYACISIDELEEILVHYGVPAQKNPRLNSSSKKSSRTSSEQSLSGHVKKVSMLESSDAYEYSEDSPEKGIILKSSPGLSDNSPFASMTAQDMVRNPSIQSYDKEIDSKKPEEFSPNFKPDEKPGNKLGVVSKLIKASEEEYESDFAEDYEEESESVIYKDSENYESEYESESSEDGRRRLNRSG